MGKLNLLEHFFHKKKLQKQSEQLNYNKWGLETVAFEIHSASILNVVTIYMEGEHLKIGSI